MPTGMASIVLSGSKMERGFSAVYKLHHSLQRGHQRFSRHFLMGYSCFCSNSFAFRHSLETVSPCTPRLSVAGYVVRKVNFTSSDTEGPLQIEWPFTIGTVFTMRPL